MMMPPGESDSGSGFRPTSAEQAQVQLLRTDVEVERQGRHQAEDLLIGAVTSLRSIASAEPKSDQARWMIEEAKRGIPKGRGSMNVPDASNSKRLLVEQVRADEWEGIYEILITCCGAPELSDVRAEFLDYMGTANPCREWRFGGWLGFGGKLYANGHEIYVECYRKHKVPLVAFAIRVANERISALLAPSPSEPDEVDKLCCCSSDCDSWECPIHGC